MGRNWILCIALVCGCGAEPDENDALAPGLDRPLRDGNFADELDGYAEWDPPIALPGLPADVEPDACEQAYVLEGGETSLNWVDHRDAAGRTWLRQLNPERPQFMGIVTHFDGPRPISRASIEPFGPPDTKRYAYNRSGQLTDEWVDRRSEGLFRSHRSYHYDDAGRLAQTRLRGVPERTFTYVDGRLDTVQIDTPEKSYERRYQYDARGRLVGVQAPKIWGETSEDRAYEGERLATRRTQTTLTAEVDCIGVGGVDYTQEEMWTLQYDDGGALVGALIERRSNPPQGLQANSPGPWIDGTPITYRWRAECRTERPEAGELDLRTPAQLQLPTQEVATVEAVATLDGNPLSSAYFRARLFDADGDEATHGGLDGTAIETPVIVSDPNGVIRVQVRAGMVAHDAHLELSGGDIGPVRVRIQVVEL